MNKIFKLCLFAVVASALSGFVEASSKDGKNKGGNAKQKNYQLPPPQQIVVPPCKQPVCPMPNATGNSGKNTNSNGNKNGNGNANANANKNVNKNDVTVNVNNAIASGGGGGGGSGSNRNRNSNFNGFDGGFGGGVSGGGFTGGAYSPSNSPTNTYSPSYSFSYGNTGYGVAGVAGAVGVVPPPNAVFNEEDPNTAWLTVEVPNEQTEVWLNGTKMPHQGIVRKYVSPPLDPKLLYNYDVKVQWFDKGVKQNHNTKIVLKAGDEIYHIVPKEGANAVPAPKALQSEEDDEKTAASKLGLAKQLMDEKKMASVKGRLEDIIKKYPKTKAAEEAKELLSKI